MPTCNILFMRACRPLQQAAALACLTLFRCSFVTNAQDFTMPGPFPITCLREVVTISPTQQSMAVKVSSAIHLDVAVTYQTSGGRMYPVVAMFNGFQAKAEWYSAIAAHIASWGYVVLQYTVPGFITIIKDREELGFLQPLLDWLAAQEGPLRGLSDVSQLATLGHSRGGKLAALHFAGRPDISTAVLLDPIDNTHWTPEGRDYPSAVRALAAANRTAGIVGAGILGPCNPGDTNYPHFFKSLAAGSWQLVIPQAGHMQFARTGNPLRDWGLDVLCRRGKTTSDVVIKSAAALAVAWLQSVFRQQEAQSGLANFWQWVASQEAQGALTFTVKDKSATEAAA